MKVEIGCDCECWNEELLRSFAQDITPFEEAAAEIGLVTQVGKIACPEPRPNGDCGAYMIYSRFEAPGLSPEYESDQIALRNIPGFSRSRPKPKNQL